MTDNRIRDSLRRALPPLLAKHLEPCSPQFGKTVFMKLVYLLQEVYKVPLGYRYTLYSYGPFSPEVSAELDRSKLQGGVDITYAGNDGGFKITSGPGASQAIGNSNAPISEYAGKIEKLVEQFGHFRAKDLELRTTVTYIWNLARPSSDPDTQDVINLVRELKPHFSAIEIQTAVDELKTNEIIAHFS